MLSSLRYTALPKKLILLSITLQINWIDCNTYSTKRYSKECKHVSIMCILFLYTLGSVTYDVSKCSKERNYTKR